MTTPTSTEDLCYTSAVELARLMREKKLSPVEVSDAFIERIDAINPKLNAYVTLHPNRTRESAKKAEAAIVQGGPLGPLQGVPFSIKDLSWSEGVRTTCGSKIHEHFIPDRDDPVVASMRNAGAVSLGKTNTPEFGWLATTDNDLFGKTNNPWNVAYTPSGSSGGAASATAAGLAPISLGSDGGGSIRHPAAFCGLFGIKPTFGRIPRNIESYSWMSLSHHGPLTRTVADAALALDVLCGFDARDLCSYPAPEERFLDNLKRDLKGLRIAYTPDFGFAEVDPGVRKAFDDALPVFEALGCIVESGSPDFHEARELFKWIMFVELVGGEYRYIDEDGGSAMSDPLKDFVLKRKDILARDYMAAMEKRRKLTAHVHEFMKDIDLLVTPTMAIPPFKHPKTMAEYPHEVNGAEVGSNGWHPFTYPFNLTGQPAASVPCGFTPDGLPLGLQIVGRRFEDLLVLQAAAAFEEARPWADRRPPI